MTSCAKKCWRAKLVSRGRPSLCCSGPHCTFFCCYSVQLFPQWQSKFFIIAPSWHEEQEDLTQLSQNKMETASTCPPKEGGWGPIHSCPHPTFSFRCVFKSHVLCQPDVHADGPAHKAQFVSSALQQTAVSIRCTPQGEGLDAL